MLPITFFHLCSDIVLGGIASENNKQFMVDRVLLAHLQILYGLTESCSILILFFWARNLVTARLLTTQLCTILTKD